MLLKKYKIKYVISDPVFILILYLRNYRVDTNLPI